MSSRFESLLARLQSGEKVIDGGYKGQEAFLILEERVLFYSADGWQYEFNKDDISWHIVEDKKHGNFLEIVDIRDPSARVYHFTDLYVISQRIISALENSS